MVPVEAHRVGANSLSLLDFSRLNLLSISSRVNLNNLSTRRARRRRPVERESDLENRIGRSPGDARRDRPRRHDGAAARQKTSKRSAKRKSPRKLTSGMRGTARKKRQPPNSPEAPDGDDPCQALWSARGVTLVDTLAGSPWKLTLAQKRNATTRCRGPEAASQAFERVPARGVWIRALRTSGSTGPAVPGRTVESGWHRRAAMVGRPRRATSTRPARTGRARRAAG